MRVHSSTATYGQYAQADNIRQNIADQLKASPQAKKTVTNIGFTLGKFGVRYTSENIELNQEAITATAHARLRNEQAQSFKEELELAAARLRNTPPSDSEQVSLDSLVRQRKGLQTYTKSALMQAYDPTLRSTIGKV